MDDRFDNTDWWDSFTQVTVDCYCICSNGVNASWGLAACLGWWLRCMFTAHAYMDPYHTLLSLTYKRGHACKECLLPVAALQQALQGGFWSLEKNISSSPCSDFKHMEFSFGFFYNLFIYFRKASDGDKELAYFEVHLTWRPSQTSACNSFFSSLNMYSSTKQPL